MVTSKSTLTVARLALQAAQRAFADYAHPKSPHKFTQPQLVACLVIKQFRRLDYRGTEVLLAEIMEIMGTDPIFQPGTSFGSGSACGQAVPLPQSECYGSEGMGGCQYARV